MSEKSENICQNKRKCLHLHRQSPPRFPQNSVPGWNFFICGIMKYNKQPLDIPAQIAMLKERGLSIADEKTAQVTLKTISYFRLAAYLRPMEADKNTHQYKPDASFENAVALYEFDAELRNMVFRAIGLIEIALRTKMIHHFSLTYNAFWFLKMSICKDEHLFLENLSSIDREIHRSKEDFIKQHYKKYTKPAYPPAWKTLELLSLGTLTKIFTNSSATKTKKAIALDFDNPTFKAFESWLASIASLRNYCAHHARIWNRNYPITPDMPASLPHAWLTNAKVPFNKLYPQLCCIAYLLNSIDPENTFTADIKALLQKYPTVDAAAMGMVKNWQDEPLWK